VYEARAQPKPEEIRPDPPLEKSSVPKRATFVRNLQKIAQSKTITQWAKKMRPIWSPCPWRLARGEMKRNESNLSRPEKHSFFFFVSLLAAGIHFSKTHFLQSHEQQQFYNELLCTFFGFRRHLLE
jgi:hypothetical protein